MFYTFLFFSIYTNRGVCLDIYRTHLLGHIVYSPDMFNATILVSFTLHNGNIRKIPFCRVLLSKYFYMEYRLISFCHTKLHTFFSHKKIPYIFQSEN